MSNRDQADGAAKCAGADDLSWLTGICDPELALSNTDRGILAAQPYSFTRNGEAWAAATDGKLAVALRQPNNFKPLPEIDLAKSFVSFVETSERLRPFGETGISDLHVWASVRTCPKCQTQHVPLSKFPTIQEDYSAKVCGFIGKTPIDKRQLMRVLPHLNNQRVTLAAGKNLIAICGDGLTIVLAGLSDHGDDEGRQSFEDFTPLKIEAKKKLKRK